MRDFVYGDDVVISAYKDGDYYPFACAEEVEISMLSELLAASSPDSGVWEQYRPSNRNSWRMSMTGVTVLKDDVDTLWYSWETLIYQLRTVGLNVKIDFTDRKGFNKYATGFVYIPESNISGKSGDFSRFAIQFQGSGPLDVNGIIVPPENPNVERLEWIIGAETKEVQNNKLIGITAGKVLEVSLEGYDIFKVITVGDPTEKQVKLDNAAGKLIFKNTLEVDDYLWCLLLS